MAATCHVYVSNSVSYRYFYLLYIHVTLFTAFIHLKRQTTKTRAMSNNRSAKNTLPGKQSRRKDKKTSLSSSSSAAPLYTQDDLMVYIPRRTILQVVGLAIKQDVQGYLHCSYLDGTIQASVHMGAPHHPGSINENPMVFKGEPATTQDEAEEGAAQAALNYICKN